ncbi:linoleoyl-CoA desaturase activity [Perkinsus olseni]|uniref:Linoleoyl-CoA desaturase activity n=1 Tax=Perkinsus olseni TaxID=32597 RepID=A0A7J6NHG0_PEROL|nr:linoleoyl-CoA desaturase activity [Perkinsus olseni]
MCSTTTITQTETVGLRPSPEAAGDLRTEADTRGLTAEEFSKVGPSVSALQSAIPPHCRERSLSRSASCVMRDLLYITACATIHYLLLTSIPEDYALLRGGLWCAYIFWQGVFFTGIWVMGHECGHGAFSPYPLVNDSVGFVLHSALLVPYFSWQYSHSRHHKFTNHITKGETHVASLKHELDAFSRIQSTLEDYGLDEVFPVFPLVMLLFGFPIYLFWNVTGGRVGYDGRPYTKVKPSHFNPDGGLFPPHMREKVLLSGLGCIISLLIAAYCAKIAGVGNVMLWYGCPYLMTNGWLTLYTSLQHTHGGVPHYGDEAFTFLRGALASVDRPPYGLFSTHFHHEIGTTHVLHHIDSRIPCYHAREATEAIKPVLGHYYRVDNTPIVKAFLRAHRECKFVEGIDGVQFYRPGQPKGVVSCSSRGEGQ